ncbi:hypothetical protein N9Z70_03915 [Mariniblastus sp.]|nr:hypothetical protein [Mariniblastus sp.]
MKIRNPKNRQGITLLFVVSMIVLFLLMGTTFVVISNDYFKAARKRGQAKLHTVDHEAVIRRAFYDVVRGPSLLNQSSPLRAHDLMSDQYGYGFKAFVTDAYDLADSDLDGDVDGNDSGVDPDQFLRLILGSNTGVRNQVQDLRKSDDAYADFLNQAEPSDPNNFNVPVAGLYNGLVFSFVTKSATGYSTRVVEHSFNTDTGNHEFIIPFPRVGQFGGAGGAIADLVESQVVVNGRDFSGTGAGGAKPATAARELGDSALQPNRVGESGTNFLSEYLDGGKHSPNESYDAADFQNMFLSGRDRDGEVIPSFHRESLSGPGGSVVVPGIGQGSNKFIPNTDDGTANSEYLYGENSINDNTFDVDSDNDGENDALFIDNGYEVMMAPDGRRFKPLVAYKVVDLDGRLNLNAHGNLTQAKDDFFISQQIPNFDNSNSLPRGQGYGPPEISFAEIVFNDDPNRDPGLPSLNANLKLEKYQYLMEGRYGQSGTPGFYNDPEPDTLRKLFGYPRGVVNWPVAVGTVNRDAADNGSLFASSAMDIHGRFSFGFPELAFVQNGNSIDDFRDPNVAGFPNGLPVIDMVGSEFGNDFEYANNPYEMTFDSQSGSNHSNSPFSPADLERHLRPFDVDTNILSKRIPFDSETDSETEMNNGIVGGIPRSKRNLITTESWDVPMIPDNFKAKLISRLPVLASDLGANSTLAQINQRADSLIDQGLFAPELLAGLKMNVNRPLGNGWDDNGNGIVDEPAEANLESNRDFTKFKNPGFDLDDDLTPNGGWSNESKARIIFTRQLYMLALLLSDVVPVDLDGDGNATPAEYSEVIAQWAVNVVDFRDPDNINTRFAFDPNPWDGNWNPAANVVWGTERPELLITETLAVHARRTEDLGDPGGNANGNANGQQNGNPNPGQPPGQNNELFDQRLRPEAFSYIELYNPWTQNSLNQRLDPSLYDNNGNQSVALDRFVLGNGGTGSPVWRLSIDRPDRDGDGIEGNDNDAGAKRFVYFTNSADISNDIINDHGNGVEVYFSDRDNAWNPYVLKPGGQALVGTLGIQEGDWYRSFMGRRTGETDLTLTLDDPDDALNTQNIRINPETGVVKRTADDQVAGRQATIIPINAVRSGGQPAASLQDSNRRGFNVSDPFGGYPILDDKQGGGQPMVSLDDGFSYGPVNGNDCYDIPLDDPDDVGNQDGNRNEEDLGAIMADEGMNRRFRVIKLQRLADPSIVWHPNDNPYLTVDVLDMDLVAFNGVEGQSAQDAIAPEKANTASTLERGAENTNDDSWKARDLFRSVRGQVNDIPNSNPLAQHQFGFTLTESLGQTNQAFVSNPANVNDRFFTSLRWNNRPFVSHLEIANVPFAGPDWLTRNFTSKQDDYDPYSGDDNLIRGRFHHLLNFFANDSDAGGGDRANLHRIMDYVEVPSRFAGTRDYLNTDNFPQPFNFLSRYRVPGKVNLNTIYSDSSSAFNQSTIWNGLQGGFASLGGGLNYQNFADSRENGNPGPGMPTDFGNPFRPSDENVNVPQNDAVPLVTEVGSTLLRNSESTSIAPMPETKPLLDFDNSAAIYNADRNAYFRNLQRQRLGNLVTTKSSVFAVWVTVGYFEVDENGLIGAEIGADTGDVKRNRGFFMFDRSIPMAFEPGKNHNIENGVLVETIIE